MHLLAKKKRMHSQWTRNKRLLMLAKDLEKLLNCSPSPFAHMRNVYLDKNQIRRKREKENECKRTSVMSSVRCPLDYMHNNVIFPLDFYCTFFFLITHTMDSVSSRSIIIMHVKIKGLAKMKCSFISHWTENQIAGFQCAHTQSCAHTHTFCFADVIHYCVLPLLDASCTAVAVVFCGFSSQRFYFL